VTPVLLFECMEIADVIITVVVIVAVVTQRSLPTAVGGGKNRHLPHS
jgi:hypothetical protein